MSGEPCHILTLCTSGLGFEPLLGKTARHFSVRYGLRPSTEVSYPDGAKDLPWPARALCLNQYVLDGINPDGSPSQYQQGREFPGKSAAPHNQTSKRPLVSTIVEEAVHVRVSQLFVDGNHRTAVLSIFEKIADAGWLLDTSAVDLYILISNRNQVEWAEVKCHMVKAILRRLRRCPFVPLQARQTFAGHVKLIAEINTLFEDVDTFLVSQGLSLDAKRSKWRCFRRYSKKRHAQFVSLYGNPHVK